ncbi:hypothetical protein ACFLZP_00955 [Patescibacteria group bacterium]
MQSITIHKLSPSLSAAIKKKAHLSEKSLNKTIKALLSGALSLTKSPIDSRRQEFGEFLKVWSQSEQKEFNQRVKVFGKVDAKDWL